MPRRSGCWQHPRLAARSALAAGAALVLAAAAASTSAAVAKDGVLAWEGWDPGRSVPVAVPVAYVWNSNYGGVSFAKDKTTVLRIAGPASRGLYWRATTLDQFEADRWLESPITVSSGPANGPLPLDPLLPERSQNRRALVRQDVEVVALADEHVVAAAQPVCSRRRGSATTSSSSRTDRARLRRAPARSAVHGLEPCATTGRSRTRPGGSPVSGCARPLPRRRPHAGRAVRHAGPRRPRRRALR